MLRELEDTFWSIVSFDKHVYRIIPFLCCLMACGKIASDTLAWRHQPLPVTLLSSSLTDQRLYTDLIRERLGTSSSSSQVDWRLGNILTSHLRMLLPSSLPDGSARGGAASRTSSSLGGFCATCPNIRDQSLPCVTLLDSCVCVCVCVCLSVFPRTPYAWCEFNAKEGVCDKKCVTANTAEVSLALCQLTDSRESALGFQLSDVRLLTFSVFSERIWKRRID